MPSFKDNKQNIMLVTNQIAASVIQDKIKAAVPLADQLLKQSYLDLRVYDTGASQKNSEIIYTPTKEGAALTFSTGPLSNVPYIPSWFFGDGRGRSASPRQTIVVAAKNFLSQLGKF